jgi:citrate synthase
MAGANEAALKMIEEINTVDHIPEFIKQVKDKNDSFHLMGFSPRTYNNYGTYAIVTRMTYYQGAEST